MLTAKTLNSSATLNNFKYLSTVNFVPDNKIVFNFRIFDEDVNERYVPPATAIVKVTLNNIDGTTLVLTAAAIDSGDRSMQTVTITQAQSLEILGGNVVFTVDMLGDGTDIAKGVIYSGLSKNLVEC